LEYNLLELLLFSEEELIHASRHESRLLATAKALTLVCLAGVTEAADARGARGTQAVVLLDQRSDERVALSSYYAALSRSCVADCVDVVPGHRRQLLPFRTNEAGGRALDDRCGASKGALFELEALGVALCIVIRELDSGVDARLLRLF